MLQQTRVAVVKERYCEFVRRFPSLPKLAAARPATVLAAWSGLGYYRRARNLHSAVKEIHARKVFPCTAAELAELPGIGRYTASAVASIAFGEPVAVLDGNVRRVLQRFLGRELAAGEAWNAAQDLLDTRRPGDFNQAMMELGALLCLPGRPVCESCPVATLCATRGPHLKPRAQRRRKAVLCYSLALQAGRVRLHRRPSGASLMPGMWELPEIRKPRVVKALMQLRHSITDTDFTVLVFAGRSPRGPGKWVPLRNAARLPLTGLARKILVQAILPSARLQ